MSSYWLVGRWGWLDLLFLNIQNKGEVEEEMSAPVRIRSRRRAVSHAEGNRRRDGIQRLVGQGSDAHHHPLHGDGANNGFVVQSSECRQLALTGGQGEIAVVKLGGFL